ncbi:MAG: TMEM175 family protein [Coprobacillaceae bacterium]
MKISVHRLEGFSDALIAIIITLMVLELKLPSTFTYLEVIELVKSIGIFFISFIIVGYQWDRHQRMFDGLTNVSNQVVWRNLLFLFFLSLIPLFTKWMIQHPSAILPALGYDIVYLLIECSVRALFVSIINESKDTNKMNEFKRLKEERSNRGELSNRRFVLFFIMLVLVILFSIYIPTISIILFLILPVATSLANIFQRERRGHNKKR